MSAAGPARTTAAWITGCMGRSTWQWFLLVEPQLLGGLRGHEARQPREQRQVGVGGDAGYREANTG